MRKAIVLILLSFVFFTASAEQLCLKLDIDSKNIPQIMQRFETLAKQLYLIEDFNIDNKQGIISGERIFKVKKRRKNRLLIGTPVEDFKKKPKWKREKIIVKGEFSNKKACISVSLTAYNKRTKKWHTLKDDGIFEEKMAEFIITTAFKNKTLYTIGNVSLYNNGIEKRVLNLTSLTFQKAFTSSERGIKTFNFVFSKNQKEMIYKVFMIGDTESIQDVLRVFHSHFIPYNPEKKVPSVYNFFWEYAKHGDIMDGMHKLQVITALGLPEKVIKQNKKEIFVYHFDGKQYNYKIVKNELILGD